MKKHNKSNRVCYVATLYALLLYILNANEDEIDNTLYILDSSFPRGFEQRLNHSYRVKDLKIRAGISRWLNWAYYRLQFMHINKKVFKRATYYIQDHKYPAKILVWNRNYTLIEDSPGVCSRYFSNSYGQRMLENRKKWTYRIFRVLYGPLYGFQFGCSEQCTSLLFTKPDNHEWLSGKELLLIPKIDINLWDSFSKTKKKYIEHIFNLDNADVENLTKRKYLLLTDPVWPDDAPYKEHDRVYHALIPKYPQSELIIKTHPRDINYPYELEFPQIPVFRKPVPLELFNLIGVRFSTIITLFSTAVTQFDSTCIHWYGTEVSPYCFKHYGHMDCPVPAEIKKL